jgi:hypothetical protein
LAYVSSIAVTPGATYTVVVGAGAVPASTRQTGGGASGAVRIVWGAGRSYPSTNVSSTTNEVYN